MAAVRGQPPYFQPLVPPPGTRLGAYEVTAPIGSGGMGEVYRARDTKLNRDVALEGRPLDQRSDIFSCGAVMYELLSGRRPFAGDSIVAVLSAVLRDEPAPLDVAGPVGAIVRRCLMKRPADRHASMTDLRAALGAIEQGAASPPRQPAIVVLPFANLSADKENEYYSDGLAEEIFNALTQLPGLRVVARASAFAFRGREHEVAVIAETLNVSSVLHGSVRRSGNRIRVSAQLIDVRDASQLWSERYDREMRDVFDIQDEIAQAIVDKLKVQLGARGDAPLVKRYLLYRMQ